jgi:hypothetical protein
MLRRGYHVVLGDRELGYFGDPETGEPLSTPDNLTDAGFMVWGQTHWIWPVDKVRSLAADHSRSETFFCGDPGNASRFIDLFDKVFGPDLDADQILAQCGLA